MVFQLRTVIAEDYLRRVKANFRSGVERALRNRVYLAGKAPFGYKRKDAVEPEYDEDGDCSGTAGWSWTSMSARSSSSSSSGGPVAPTWLTRYVQAEAMARAEGKQIRQALDKARQAQQRRIYRSLGR